MSASQRRKGRDGENEARGIFVDAGFTVTPMQAGRTGRVDTGDFLAAANRAYTPTPSGAIFTGRDPVVLVVDAKRREKVRVVEWARAIEHAARIGEVPVTIWRQSREPWRVTLLAEDFARLVAR